MSGKVKIQYSRGASAHDATPVQVAAGSPQEFIQNVLHDRIKNKHDGFITAACGIAPDDDTHRNHKTKIYAIGKPHRCAACAQPRAFIGLDIDESLTPEKFERLKDYCSRWFGALYTTASHTPEAPRCRLLFPLDRALPREELKQATWIVQWFISEAVGGLVYDAACDKAEQPLFLPLKTSEVVQFDNGSLLSAEALLAAFWPEDIGFFEKDGFYGDAHPEDAREALAHLDPDDGYSHWLTVGMALHASLGATGLQLWEEWSQSSTNYDAAELKEKWEGFGGGTKLVTIGTVYKLAKLAGWKGPTRAKNDLADQINDHLRFRLKDPQGVFVRREVLQNILTGAFWSHKQKTVFFLNGFGNFVGFSAKDAPKQLRRRFGSFIDNKAVSQAALAAADDPEKSPKLASDAKTSANELLLDDLKYTNQRERVAHRVDLFGDRDFLNIRKRDVEVVLRHRTFEERLAWRNDKVVADFKEHFPQFDDFVEFLAAARMAEDRKKAYLWLHAVSDFGKGLLVGALEELGIVVEMSIEEVTKAARGEPLAKDSEHFIHAWVVVMNEFRKVTPSIKKMERHLSIAPKNQLQQTVEIFAKLFTSADTVDSLVTDNGVEDQLANRFSEFNAGNKITDRPLYQEVQGPAYRRALAYYIAGRLNERVEQALAMGQERAVESAQRWLDSFNDEYGLKQRHGSVTDNLDLIASDIRGWLPGSEYAGFLVDGHGLESGQKLLASPGKVVREYLHHYYDPAQIAMLSGRKEDIYAALSADGKGVYPYYVDKERQRKAILVQVQARAEPF